MRTGWPASGVTLECWLRSTIRPSLEGTTTSHTASSAGWSMDGAASSERLKRDGKMATIRPQPINDVARSRHWNSKELSPASALPPPRERQQSKSTTKEMTPPGDG